MYTRHQLDALLLYPALIFLQNGGTADHIHPRGPAGKGPAIVIRNVGPAACSTPARRRWRRPSSGVVNAHSR